MTESVITDEMLEQEGWEMIPTEEIDKRLNANIDDYTNGEIKSAKDSMQAFRDRVDRSLYRKEISTGFKPLDDLLGGGLREGLYVVGAVPSLGKTTFLLQIADYMAQHGQDVLFFTLEQSKFELIGKSVSRYTGIIAKETYVNGWNGHAKSYLQVVDRKHRKEKNCPPVDEELIRQAMNRYENEVSEHLFFYQRPESGIIRATEPENVKTRHPVFENGRITGYITEDMPNDLMGVNQYIENFIEAVNRPATLEEMSTYDSRHPKRKPVIIIDYLQILDPPEDSRNTDKQNTDKAITMMKQLSRKYEIPVMVISSYNRNSYTNEASMSSGKESGSLEYSADVLIGLQYGDPVDYKKSPTEISKRIEEVKSESKKGNAITIEAKIIKNRAGTTGTIELDFYPMFSWYTDPRPKEN